MLPAPVAARVRAASLLAVSGARRVSPALAALARAVVAARPAGSPVLVGCAAGVDAIARRHPAARVLHASAFGQGAGAFAARSAALVRQAGAWPGALLVALPGGACPCGLLPSASRAFSGHGAGTWGTLAFAVARGLPVLVALPGAAAPPGGWPLRPVATQGAFAWWGWAPSAPAVQGSLW